MECVEWGTAEECGRVGPVEERVFAATLPVNLRVTIDALRLHGDTLVDGVIGVILVQVVVWVLPRVHRDPVTDHIGVGVRPAPHVVDQGIEDVCHVLQGRDVQHGQRV